MKLLFNTKPAIFFYFGFILIAIIFGFRQKASLKLSADPEPSTYGGSLNQDQVKDFEQNFIWFYKRGGINPTLTTPDLMFDVTDDFFAHIDTTNWTVPTDSGIALYYSIASDGDNKYFTYLITNAYSDKVTDSIFPLGLYDNTQHEYVPDKYLRLNHNQSPATTEITGKQDYVTHYISYVYMNQINDTIVKIDTFPEHPHVCFLNMYTLYNFYNDNRLILSGDREKKIMVKHGAMDKGLLLNNEGISNCKVQTPVLIFKYNGTLLLDNEAHLNAPFKNHAMDIGQMCPPGHCTCY